MVVNSCFEDLERRVGLKRVWEIVLFALFYFEESEEKRINVDLLTRSASIPSNCFCRVFVNNCTIYCRKYHTLKLIISLCNLLS